MWIKIGPEHVNLEAAASILEIEGGFEIRHGRTQYSTIQATEPKQVDPTLDGVEATRAQQRFEYEEEQYLSNRPIVEQITAFLLEKETVKKPRTTKKG